MSLLSILTLSRGRPLCTENQWTGFYMITAYVLKGLRGTSELNFVSPYIFFILQYFDGNCYEGHYFEIVDCLTHNCK